MKTYLPLLILVILLFSSFAKPELTFTTPYQIGDMVKDFHLKSVSNKMVSLKDYQNQKGVVVIFICNTCPIVQLYEQRIKDLHAFYSAKGYPVLAINANSAQRQPGDSFEKMQEKATKQSYPFDYLLDETQEVAKSFGATNTPQAYLLQQTPQGWQLQYMGAVDNSAQDPNAVTKTYLKNAIDALLAGKEVKTTKTKAVGCSIKWL